MLRLFHFQSNLKMERSSHCPFHVFFQELLSGVIEESGNGEETEEKEKEGDKSFGEILERVEVGVSVNLN